jgi:hypothetical protein
MTRKIKIENRGDSFHRETIPAFRLKGKWLNSAQVEVSSGYTTYKIN